jgi:hypothetical protein
MRSNAYTIESLRHMQRHILRYDNTSVVSDTNITLRALDRLRAGRALPRVCEDHSRVAHKRATRAMAEYSPSRIWRLNARLFCGG